MALDIMGFTGAAPIGSLVQGWLAEVVGVRATVVGAGLLLVGVGVLAGGRVPGRRRRRPRLTHPGPILALMDVSSSVRFAGAVRALSRAARALDLAVPGFRSPPRLPGVDRTLRRRADGSVSVAVRLRGRPWPAVLADLVEGVVAANRLDGVDADRVRAALWSAVGDQVGEAAAPRVGGARRRLVPVPQPGDVPPHRPRSPTVDAPARVA